MATVTLNPTTNTGGTGAKVVSNGKRSITVNKVFDTKPTAGSLAVGEVGMYKDSKGRDVYVVGKVNGGVSKATTSVSKAYTAVTKVIKSAESAQIANLKQDNKIEIIEIKKTLANQGLSKAEINAAVKAEEAANKQEVKQVAKELKTSGYQTISRGNDGLLSTKTVADTSKGISVPVDFNTTTVANPDGTRSTQWTSLSYNGTGADAIKSNIASNLELVNQLKVNYGLLGDVYTYSEGKGSQSTTGVSDAALYGAIRNEYIKYDDATKNFYVDYAGDQINTRKDENGFGWTSQQLRKAGGKGFERSIQNILNRDTAIGDKAFTVTDAKGNVFITNDAGKQIKGSALKDSGQTDSAGNKIFVQEVKSDTKYNKVSLGNVYVQNSDGSFTYMGTPDVAYTHIDKQDGFNLGGFVASVGLSILATAIGAPALGSFLSSQFGLTKGVADIAAAALIGGGISAVKGSGLEDILTDSVLAGLGQAVGGIVSEAAKQAGGWTNLADDMVNNGLSGYVKSAADTLFSSNAATGIKLTTDAAGNVVSALDDTLTSGTQVGTGVNLNQLGTNAGNALATTGNGLLDEIISSTPSKVGGTTAGDILESQMGGVTDIANAVNLNPITTAPGINAGPGISLGYDKYGSNTVVNPATGNPYAPPGVNLSYDAAGNIIGDTGTGLGMGVNLVNPETGSLVTPPAPAPIVSPPGLLESVTNAAINNPWTTAAVIGGAAAIPPIVDAVNDYLNPDTDTTTYPPVYLNLPNISTNMLGMPDWWQNLYQRGGYGAGSYLGYDVLRGLNVPGEVQSLLGMPSGQNTGSSLIA